MLDVAHRLAIVLAGLSPAVVDQHEPVAERGAQRQVEQGAHGDVDDAEDGGMGAPSSRATSRS